MDRRTRGRHPGEAVERALPHRASTQLMSRSMSSGPLLRLFDNVIFLGSSSPPRPAWIFTLSVLVTVTGKA
jgi:hypothetical protein